MLNSEDGTLPSTLGFGADSPVEAGAWSPYWWLFARDSMLSYDLAFNQTLVATLERSPAGVVESIVFNVPGKTVRAKRVQDDQVNLPCIAK